MEITVTVHGPEPRSRRRGVVTGPCAITKAVAEFPVLPIGSTCIFHLPFSESEKSEGAEVIHANGVFLAKIDHYSVKEKGGKIESMHVDLIATMISIEEFQQIVSAPWLGRFGWIVSEVVIPG